MRLIPNIYLLRDGIAPPLTPKLYKVLVGGKSCHGGSLAWSLPSAAGPGEWHEIDGSPVLCKSGFHLTKVPPKWHEPGCDVYEWDEAADSVMA